MPLANGARLGPYDIVSAVGKGGMGEVYRARDTRLGRDVAIKVSATEFTERFTREARAVAALNHSNVCHLYDVGPDYLVLEYIEGESPAGPMPFDEALPIIRQLVDGIEAAHEKNIIHRDLKAANIRITPEGVVKILDFGLAKAAETDANGNAADSPTFTMGATQSGVIVGTAAYMAPEQAKGKSADRRSDIWSFGVVVYELLVGRTPFEGESAVEILGQVMSREPDWSRVPPRAQRLLRACLQKDRRQRLAAISDARMLLDEPKVSVAPSTVARARRSIAWPAAATTLILATCVSAYGWWRATRPADRALVRLSVDLGPQATRGSRVTALISPDGSRLAFTGRAETDGLTRLYLRRFDEQEASPMAGTAYGSLESLFFSPAGDWIGYLGNGQLMKVSVEGGLPAQVAPVGPQLVGASWGDDGQIIAGSRGGLMRVPATGGMLDRLTETPMVFPHVLPGSRAVLVNTSPRAIINLENLDIEVVDLATRAAKTLVKGGYGPSYVPTSSRAGHLVFIRNGTLFGVAFDPEQLEIRGTPIPLIRDVAAGQRMVGGGGQYSFSDTGIFVYLSGAREILAYPVQWLERSGDTKPLVAPPNGYIAPRLSPDGRRLAYNMFAPDGPDTWVYDIARETPSQVTFNGSGVFELAWSADSKHLVYGDSSAIWWISADGAGQPIRLLDGMINPRPGSFAPDGRLAFSAASRQGATPDLWTLPLDFRDPDHPKPGKPEPFLNEPQIAEVDPAFSPDGKFLAYASSESGREEIFVRPFPGPGMKVTVSSAGGKFPAWSRTRELFFLGGDDRIMVVGYTVQGAAFQPDRPRVWSPTPIRRDGVRQNFDISADGRRAVIFPRPELELGAGTLHVTFLLNFFDEVRRRVPADGAP